MSRFNTSTSHPLIPNAQEYMFEQQYISIDSADRNILKYPKANDFEIELPQDYLNVQGFRLTSGCFPVQFSTFSPEKQNVTMTFFITSPYNPNDHGVTDALQIAIYDSLLSRTDTYFSFVVETGNYTEIQMANEVMNKMNHAVTTFLLGTDSMLSGSQKTTLESQGGYLRFITAYHDVSQKLWIANELDGFVLSNTITAKYEEQNHPCLCDDNNNVLPSFKEWGLPGYLGFSRCDVTAKERTSVSDTRFYYTNDGEWISSAPVFPGAIVHYVEAPFKMNLKPPCYMYMEIRTLNFMDETAPYNYSKFTQETNQTNGIVKSAFAKIPLMSGENFYESLNVANNYKIYNPPVERIRKLGIRLRYHNGMLVDFGNSDMTFTLEFTLFRPQNNRVYNMRVPESIQNPF